MVNVGFNANISTSSWAMFVGCSMVDLLVREVCTEKLQSNPILAIRCAVMLSLFVNSIRVIFMKRHDAFSCFTPQCFSCLVQTQQMPPWPSSLFLVV